MALACCAIFLALAFVPGAGPFALDYLLTRSLYTNFLSWFLAFTLLSVHFIKRKWGRSST